MSLTFANGCHDMFFSEKNNIVSFRENAYRVHFSLMSQNDAINLLNNSVLSNKGVL